MRGNKNCWDAKLSVVAHSVVRLIPFYQFSVSVGNLISSMFNGRWNIFKKIDARRDSLRAGCKIG